MQTPIFTASHGAMPFRRQKPPAAQGGTRLDLTRLDLEDRTRRRLPSHPPTSAVRPCHPGDTLDPSNWIDPADGKARPRMNLFLKSPARSPARYTGTPSSRDPRRIPMTSAGYVRHFASDEFEDEPQSNEKHERKDKQKEELPRHPPTSAVRPCHPWDTFDPYSVTREGTGFASPPLKPRRVITGGGQNHQSPGAVRPTTGAQNRNAPPPGPRCRRSDCRHHGGEDRRRGRSSSAGRRREPGRPTRNRPRRRSAGLSRTPPEHAAQRTRGSAIPRSSDS